MATPGTRTGSQPSQVDIVFHESHASIPRPALLVVVADNVLVVRVRVLCQVALDELPGLLGCEPEPHHTVSEDCS